MLADGSEFACEEEVAANYGIILQDDKQVGEQLNSRFRVLEKLHQDVILGSDWLQKVKPQVDWVNYGVTLINGFVAADVSVYRTVKVDLCSFKALMHFLHANKGKNSCFTFVQ